MPKCSQCTPPPPPPKTRDDEIRERYWRNRQSSSELGFHVEKAKALAAEYGMSIEKFSRIVFKGAIDRGSGHCRPMDLPPLEDH